MSSTSISASLSSLKLTRPEMPTIMSLLTRFLFLSYTLGNTIASMTPSKSSRVSLAISWDFLVIMVRTPLIMPAMMTASPSLKEDVLITMLSASSPSAVNSSPPPVSSAVPALVLSLMSAAYSSSGCPERYTPSISFSMASLASLLKSATFGSSGLANASSAKSSSWKRLICARLPCFAFFCALCTASSHTAMSCALLGLISSKAPALTSDSMAFLLSSPASIASMNS